MASLLRWLRRPRVRRLSVTIAPSDVLLQSVMVLRELGARVVRCDVEEGTLEARLAAGTRLRLAASAEAAGSRVTLETDGADWHGVTRTLQHELARGGGA